MQKYRLSSVLRKTWSVPVFAVFVAFPNADRYADIGRDPADAQRALTEIQRHLEQLGDRYLPADQTLNIEVLDITLAGRAGLASSSTFDTRVIRGTADWPSIKLRYTLASQGRVLASREETVADKDYLRRRSIAYSSLPYEKRMLDEWFQSRFAKPAGAR